MHTVTPQQRGVGGPPPARDARAPAADGQRGSTRPDGLPVARDPTLAYLASLLLVVLLAVASVAGILLAPAGLYGGDPTRLSVFVGQDVANLVVGLPILLGTTWLARRDSLLGLLLWPGALYYVLYTYALYLVGAPFNVLFLLYVVLVALSAYTTIGVVASIDGGAVRQRLSRVPARAIGGALVGVGLLATAGLTALVIPALADPMAADPLLRARWIVDYTVGNPALLIGGVLLWRRAGLGYATAGGLLFLAGANGVAFAVGGVLGASLAAAPIDATVVAVHLGIAAVCLVVLACFLRGAPAGRGAGPTSAAPAGRSQEALPLPRLLARLARRRAAA
jgi:hypothetical protein